MMTSSGPGIIPQTLAAPNPPCTVCCVTTRRTRPTGRPSPILTGWDPDTGQWAKNTPVQRFLDAIRVGNYRNTSAGYARVHRTSIIKWEKRGRTVYETWLNPETGELDRSQVPDEDKPYVDFVIAVGHAEDSSEVDLVTLWRSAATEDWRAAKELLARRHRARWGDVQRLEHVGDPDAPIGVEVHDSGLRRLLVDVAHADDSDASAG